MPGLLAAVNSAECAELILVWVDGASPFLSVVHGQSIILNHLVFIGLFCLANGTDCLEVVFCFFLHLSLCESYHLVI